MPESKQPTFNPLIRYRNMLIGVSREIIHLEEQSARMEAKEASWSKGKAKEMNRLAGRLRNLIAKNGRAMTFFFKTRSPQEVWEQPIQMDEETK